MRDGLDHLRKPYHPANRAIVVSFLAAVFAPLVFTLASLSRMPADPAGPGSSPWPARPQSVKDIGKWPTRFRHWFTDHYVFRRALIQTHGELLFRGVGVSPSPTVLIGKDGWWYYTDDGALDDIVSAEPMDESSLEAWRRTLESNRAWLASQGIPYVFVMTPDKHAVYPEFLPDTVRAITGSRIDQLAAYLSTHSSVDVLDLLSVLREAKPQDRLFHRTDTHWNNRGALVGWLALAQWMGRVHEGFRVPTREDYVFSTAISGGHDLPRMLGIGHLVTEEVLEAHNRPPARFQVTDPVGSPSPYDEGRLITEHPDATLPRVLVFRDSFMTCLVPFLAEHCRRCVFLWQKDLDPEAVRREKPDLVIHQIVGRRFQGYLPYDAVAAERQAGQVAR
jgi:hypothetical protein